MSVPSEWWLITLPNDRSGSDSTFRRLEAAVPGLAASYKLEAPQLKIGTLDSLMSLSDELGKHDAVIEMVIRKIERQYTDMAGASAPPLLVGSLHPTRFVEHFTWDVAKFSKRRALPELVQLILSGVGSVEDELKQLASALTEATQRLAGLTRKKGGNLASTPLDEVIKPEMERGFLDSEYLKTVCVVVPKASEAEFLTTYHTLGGSIAGYGGPDWRNSRGCGEPDNNYGPFCDRKKETGSPVVPGSATKLLTEGEHILFTVVILKGQYEAGYMDEDDTFQPGNYVDFTDTFKAAAREKRFIVREYTKAGDHLAALGGHGLLGPGADAQNTELADVEVAVAEKQAGLERWCRTHFGEAFSAWIHLKTIRAFVESVLRYGLSSANAGGGAGGGAQESNFMLAALKVSRGKGLQLKAALDKLLHVTAAADEDEEEGEYHPYCKLEFTIA